MGYLGYGQRAPSPPAVGRLGECCKLLQRGPRLSPGKICILDALRAPKRVLWPQMPCQFGTHGGGAIAPVPPGYAYVGIYQSTKEVPKYKLTVIDVLYLLQARRLAMFCQQTFW